MKCKLLLSICFSLFLLNGINAQEYYWSSQKKNPLTVDSKRAVLHLVENSALEARLRTNSSFEKIERISEHSVMIVIKDNGKLLSDEITGIASNSIASFLDNNGEPIIPTGEILFEPKKGVSISEVNKVCENQLTVLDKEYSNYTVLVKDYARIFELANKLYESGLVEYSHPNFIGTLVKFQNDPLYPQQYYLNNTGQFGGTAGIDINGPQALTITEGLTDVKVAVIDDGVENHIDINGRVLSGYTVGNPNGNGSPAAGAAHGQACAGIIGASLNNNEGITGIAPCTEIVPIDIFSNINASAGQIRDAIDWAWDEGEADVLSNSWGYPASDAITQAIGRARTQGRNGRGSVVVFASGNSGGAVSFPGNVSGVLTVGAIDRNGNLWAYSSRGPQMDVVAPTGNVNLLGDVRTTDRPGINGYVNGNYVDTFGGTSAACPQVAGVAALMLSFDPFMTESQVKNIIKFTATGTGFNNNVGHGRLNAQAALQQVTPKILGPSKFCPSGVMKVGEVSGGTISWSVSPSNSLSFTQGASTNTFTRIGSFSGSATITATLNPACGTTRVITKNVTVGGTINFTWSGVGPFGQLDVNVTSGTAPYKIYRGSTLLYSGYSNPRTVNFGCNGGVLKVEANTACGIASKSVIVPQGCASFRGQSAMVVFPNPTSFELNIAQLDEFKEARSEDDIGSGELQLYDFDGNKIKSHKFSRIGHDTKMNLSDLKKGVYILRIIAKEVDEVHQVIVR
ncbi:S8 family serine peptidase [Maribacter sp. Hel_I_7]|uniref:S8 family serine peptidase n=1 Tax=Maribacter sp. Hel_I_7 TaxID=1249997 RepID=UPI000689B0A2|nr:S8 family serine peptidase [Maribacter sp. Hel_I_7]